ncbi:hypothetical protein GCM10023354_15710 [Garicola koreensis]
MEARHAMRRTLRRGWPYLVVAFAGAVIWSTVWGAHVETIPAGADEETVGSTGAFMLLDLVVGVIAVALIPLQRRAPLTIAILAALALAVSAFASGAAILAAFRFATTGTRTGVILLGAMWVLSGAGNVAVVFPVLGSPAGAGETVVILTLGVLIYVALVALGRYRQARIETLRLVHERAVNAERERERHVKAAREAERLRIAREMHDILAHRISLVSMHAGTLAYRDDLPREQMAQAASVIKDNSAVALRELRQILGVLRDNNDSGQNAPQPTLAQLPALLAEARASGSATEIEFFGISAEDEEPILDELDPSLSRAAYRIVQEALTNARKHAPGLPVHIRIERTTGQLSIEVRNKVPPGTYHTNNRGMGLVGLSERLDLLGGSIDYQRTSESIFVVRAWLPWW